MKRPARTSPRRRPPPPIRAISVEGIVARGPKGSPEAVSHSERERRRRDLEEAALIEAVSGSELVAARFRRSADVLAAQSAAAAARQDAQQAGNRARDPRRTRADLEKAAQRHRDGEKWDAIAPDFGVRGDRLRALIRAAGIDASRRK